MSESAIVTSPSPASSMVQGVPDAVLVGVITVSGVLVGALIALVGHLLISRTARKNRLWTSVWPEKAKAYEALLEWSRGGGSMTDIQVWVQAQIYASKKVRTIINDYLEAQTGGDVESLRAELGPAIRDDLKTNTKLE
jgi:hypothetical protein